jgi:hypothetical protein
VVTPSDRKSLVNQYNSAVDTWVSTGYGAYTNVSFKLSFANGVTNILAADYSADKLKDNGNDIKSYTQYLKYDQTYSPHWKSPSPTGSWPTQDSLAPTLSSIRAIGHSITVTQSMLLGPAAVNELIVVSVSGNTTYQRRQNCLSGGNQWDGSACRQSLVLFSACAIADLSVTSRTASIGNSAAFSGCFPPTVGSSLTLYQYMQGNYNPTTMNVYVRSSQDPYVVALQITHGSLSFGLSEGQRLTLGFILIGIGAFLAIPFCCVCYCVCGKSDRRANYIGRFRGGNSYVPMMGGGDGYPQQGGYQQPGYNPNYAVQGQYGTSGPGYPPM